MTTVHLSRVDSPLGDYQFQAGDETIVICKGWRLVGDARRGALMGRWYVATPDRDRRLGNTDGYRYLSSVRDHIAAAEADRLAGEDVRWGVS